VQGAQKSRHEPLPPYPASISVIIMIKEIKKLRDKYNKIAKHSEYVSVGDVLCDLYHLEQDARLKRIPKWKR